VDTADRMLVQLARAKRRLEARMASAENVKLRQRFGACGDGVRLNGPTFVSNPEQMRVGANVHIGANAFIRAGGGLTIGDNTHISRNLVLYTVNHDYTGNVLPYDELLVPKPVTIGRNVWIGMNVCIAPGTVIGDGAIVGMGTTVSGDVPELAIVGSGAWRQLGHRDVRHYRELDAARAYGGADGRPLP
jgi:maltose O-acetyltransferase